MPGQLPNRITRHLQTQEVTSNRTTNMNLRSRLKYSASLLIAAVTLLTTQGASASLTSDARAALRQLIAQNPAARGVSEKALGVLVFPNVVKAGFIFGGQSGQGILFYGDKAAGRYRTTAASYGLQAGAQKFGYALFFMNQKALDWVNAAHGWSNRFRPEPGRGGPGHGSHDEHRDTPQWHLRLHLRSAGPHGRNRNPGIQNSEARLATEIQRERRATGAKTVVQLEFSSHCWRSPSAEHRCAWSPQAGSLRYLSLLDSPRTRNG